MPPDLPPSPPAAPPAPPPPRVVAVVVHYRNAPATLRCLDLIDRQQPLHPDGVLVRNAHPDTEAAWPQIELDARNRGWTLLDPGRNTGFAAGSNLGIAHAQAAQADFVWLLNPDTQPAPDALHALLSALDQNPHLAAAGSDLGNGPPGGQLSLWHAHARESHHGPWHFLSGASLLLRLTALTAVGTFDENLFLYWEDVELCLRLRRAGFGLTVVPHSRVPHEGGGAVGRASPVQDYCSSRNGLLVVRKHAPDCLPVAAPAVLARITLAKLLRAEWSRLAPAWRGWWHGLRGLGGPPPPDLIAPHTHAPKK